MGIGFDSRTAIVVTPGMGSLDSGERGRKSILNSLSYHPPRNNRAKGWKKSEKSRIWSNLVRLVPWGCSVAARRANLAKFGQIWPFPTFFRVFPQTEAGADFRRVRLFWVDNPTRGVSKTVIFRPLAQPGALSGTFSRGATAIRLCRKRRVALAHGANVE